jgi:hypothetical protein
VYLSRFPWRALLLWQLRIFAAAAARPDPTPPPFFGEGSTKKIKLPVASALAVGHVGVCVGVMEVAVQCKHHTSEV